MEKEKIMFKGSHPDSLYRVTSESGAGGGKMARLMRVMRWPVALFAVCVALAIFVYFLMPDTPLADNVNGTYWEPNTAFVHSANDQFSSNATPKHGTKTTEIDFYEPENDNTDDAVSMTDLINDKVLLRKLPAPPVFPSHIAPEVQYGNERAETENLRSGKLLEQTNTVPEDSTLKPHITHKPEKPLAIYFIDGEGALTTTTSTEAARTETVNDFTDYEEKQTTKKAMETTKTYYKPYRVYDKVVEINHESPEEQGFYHRLPGNQEAPAIHFVPPSKNEPMFTSGHSKLFGISVEDAEKMKSTTQSSLYNTRVSPTLPTWRDREATTNNYPVYANADAPQCRSTRLPLCRGVLPYDLAGPSIKVSGVDVMTVLGSIEYLVGVNCSARLRHFVCALLEPECNPPPYPAKIPCQSFCKALGDDCDGLIPRQLSEVFNCMHYPTDYCVTARPPCHNDELSCGGTCIPRDWMCDGNKDCPGGEDELNCSCEPKEYRCRFSGSCILRRWTCDGYADCPDGEDEAEALCGPRAPRDPRDPGEEAAGSAPAPAVRRPNNLPVQDRQITGDNDSSKELLITSDSNNALKRNFTRRPSASRLTPYTRTTVRAADNNTTVSDWGQKTVTKKPTTPKAIQMTKAVVEEEINTEDLGFFDELPKATTKTTVKKTEASTSVITEKAQANPPPFKTHGLAPIPDSDKNPRLRLDKGISKLHRKIDGSALLKMAEEERAREEKDDETSGVNENNEIPALPASSGSISAHASPCPTGELRCVDGRCITLAQLCDGTIDCTDHADEDNCYT